MDLRNRFYCDNEVLIDFAHGDVFRKLDKRGRKIDKWRKVGCKKDGYIIFYYNGKKIRLHRFIMEKYIGRKLGKNEEIDHINLKKDDNSICNLRIVSRQQNQQNRYSQKNSSSIYKGVHFFKRDKKWQSYILNPLTRKREHLGLFNNEKLAAKTYNQRAEYFNKHYNSKYKLNKL